MDKAAFGTRFLESTRGQIVTLLRRGPHTVEALARALQLTDNAVRSHLSGLERDGLVRQAGVRRAGGVGKPAVLYELDARALPLLSRAYPPVLGALMDVLVDELPADRAERILRRVGQHLARELGGPAAGDFETRVRAGAAVLTSLGGDVEVVPTDEGELIRGSGCPLSAVVAQRPETCLAVESLLGEVCAATVRSKCEHGSRPRCRFAVAPVGAAA